MNTGTSSGSNWLPAQRWSSRTASAAGKGFRYGRSLVIAS